jgi:hypothetical protein
LVSIVTSLGEVVVSPADVHAVSSSVEGSKRSLESRSGLALEGESLSGNRFGTVDSISEDVSSSDADTGSSVLSKLSRGESASSVKVVVSKLVVSVTSTAGKSLPLSVRVNFNLVSSDSGRARSLLPGDSGWASGRSSLDKRSSMGGVSGVSSGLRPGTDGASRSTDSEANGRSTAVVLSDIVERDTVRVTVVASNVEVDISEDTVSIALLELVGSGSSRVVVVDHVGSPVHVDAISYVIESD